MGTAELVRTVSAGVTGGGVLIAALQFGLGRLQRKTEFEDSIVKQYRETIRPKLVTAALLGEKLTDSQIEKLLPAFYSYFDLCNEQVFLRMHGRIRKRTWRLWYDGIMGNLVRSGFKESWQRVRAETRDFNELRLVTDCAVAGALRAEPSRRALLFWRRGYSSSTQVMRVTRSDLWIPGGSSHCGGATFTASSLSSRWGGK